MLLYDQIGIPNSNIPSSSVVAEAGEKSNQFLSAISEVILQSPESGALLTDTYVRYDLFYFS